LFSCVAQEAEVPKQFRLNAMSCLLTYNGDFNSSKWQDFLEWVRQCEHFHRWTATMEQSLHSAQEQRLHVHLFVEFGRRVDWNSLRLVSFDNITPNCRVTQARGPRMREAMDQGHFYAWAWKDSSSQNFFRTNA